MRRRKRRSGRRLEEGREGKGKGKGRKGKMRKKETGEHRKSGRIEIANTKTERTDRQSGEKANQKAERAKKKLGRGLF